MAIQAMNIAIKNNNAMRPKRERFKKTLGGYGKRSKTEYSFPKATSKQLRSIRKQMQKEQKSRLLQQVVITIIMFLILLLSFDYLSDGLLELLWY